MTNQACPKCKSEHVVKSGMAIRAGGKRQRYQCPECGATWVAPKQNK